MIKSIEFCQPYRCFKPGDRFEFRKGVNLIVGDQGCGKTTILDAIGGETVPPYGRPDSMEKLQERRKLEMSCQKEPFRKFDFEQENPRVRGMNLDSLGSIGASFWSKTKSHGEVVRAVLHEATNTPKAKAGIWLLDEPDAALSVRSIRKLVETLKEMAAKKCQVIVTAHNPHLIMAFDEVLSLEHRRWMPSSEFLHLHETTEREEPRAENDRTHARKGR